MERKICLLTLSILSVIVAGGGVLTELDVCSVASCSETYGVDTSFPTHHQNTIQEENNPLNARSKRQLYRQFIEECESRYSSRPHACLYNEQDRIDMNLNQPKSMFNYTSLGFYKTRAPPALMEHLTSFWNNNTSPSAVNSIPEEEWPAGNTYTNHWSSPTKMLNLQDLSLHLSGDALRTKIWDGTKDILEQWTGVELSPTSLYGVRIYTKGAILAPHVDRNPLVISAIINVAQDVQEDWPLEVIGHDGQAYNISLEVGGMILYESHSVIHGRPFPLNGEYYANIFCHFEPVEYSLINGQTRDDEMGDSTLESLYQAAWEQQRRLRTRKCGSDEQCYKREHVDLNTVEMMPRYIVPESREGKRWLQSHPDAKLLLKNKLIAHAAAAGGDLETLEQLAAHDSENLKRIDSNGWSPLHEAARAGHVKVVSYLLSNGLDINQRTHGGTGGSVLWWSKKAYGKDHPVRTLLKNNGAVEIAPE